MSKSIEQMKIFHLKAVQYLSETQILLSKIMNLNPIKQNQNNNIFSFTFDNISAIGECIKNLKNNYAEHDITTNGNDLIITIDKNYFN